MKHKFSVLRDDDSEFSLISGPYTDCDWPIYFVIRLEFTEEWGDSPGYPFHCSFCIVSPDAVDSEELNRARNYCGIDSDTWQTMANEWRCECLLSYGTYATIWQQTGHNKAQLIREAKREMIPATMLTGFYLDRQQNAIGNTGWDFLQGTIGFRS